jgi:hypothetical protein
MYEDADLDRALWDDKTSGPTSRSHPLQCALHLQRTLDSPDRLDGPLLAFLNQRQDRNRRNRQQQDNHEGKSENYFEGNTIPSAAASAEALTQHVSAILWAARSEELYSNGLFSHDHAPSTSQFESQFMESEAECEAEHSLQEGLEFAWEMGALAAAAAAGAPAPPPAPAPTSINTTTHADFAPASADLAAGTSRFRTGVEVREANSMSNASNPHFNGSGTGSDAGGFGQNIPAPMMASRSVSRAPAATAAAAAVPTSRAGSAGAGASASAKGRGDQTAAKPFASSKDVYVREVAATGGVAAFKMPSSTASSSSSGDSSRLGKRALGQGSEAGGGEDLPAELAHLDKALVQKILSDILVSGQAVRFSDIAGLADAKSCVQELICWPITRPDLFQGLRALPRGVLLFGPPGTGKTLIGKAIAHEAGATFFSISASSLMSKWIGEGERTVKTLFAVACYRQPSVVFLDEVDSLLTQRSSEENEASRRMKTEFLVQLDGAGTDQAAQVVIVGASNRPEELDEAARRRFVKRIYIPLPDKEGREALFKTLLNDAPNALLAGDIGKLVDVSKGFSGADIRALCTEAAMGPMREIARSARGDLRNLRSEDVPLISWGHFQLALEAVKPTVNDKELTRYIQWNAEFGSFKNIATPT